MGDWNWKAARLELDRAVQWSPGSADAHSAFAIAYLAPMGQFEAAEYEARKAVELDPLSFLANYVAGTISLAQGKNEDAMEHFRTALAIYADFSDVHWDYGMALAAAGHKDEARQEFVKACELKKIKSCDPGPVGYAILGDADKSRQEIAAQKPRPMEAARAWALLGERDKAFAELDQAIEQRDPQVMYLRTDTRFSKVRNDPRFAAALQRLKLNE
jgi:tetratricopeptide (TPR) repeat protein